MDELARAEIERGREQQRIAKWANKDRDASLKAVGLRPPSPNRIPWPWEKTP